MDRGLKIVLAGLVPILSVFVLSAIIDVSPATAGVLVALGFLGSGALFLTGTALIVTDKGHPMVLGIVLGFLAPLGTIIASILEDQTGSAANRPSRPIENRDRSPTRKKSKPGTFGPLREMIIRVAGFAGIGYALCYSVIYSLHLLKYQGGIPAAKVFIAVFSGLTAGLTLWGTVVMFTITFAPQR